MMKSLYTAATGMEAQQTRISVIANNLANLSTAGFKQGKAVFQDLLYQTISEPGAETASGVSTPAAFQVGSGVRVVSTPTVHSQGVLEQTARQLDVAIEGEGFFQITLPEGTGYTRAGSFSINADGELVTQSGFQVEPAISGLSGVSSLSIGEDGTVSGILPGQTELTNFGQLQLAIFANPSGLKSAGRNLYTETSASGAATLNNPGTNGSGLLRQGFLEGSNVNVAEELIRMIMAQRSFELNSKVIRTSDDMMSAINQMR